jgi:hypothetical protein
MNDWPVWEDICSHCGAENQDEDPHYRFECPECEREGCSYCMPMGRGCACPECEESDGSD